MGQSAYGHCTLHSHINYTVCYVMHVVGHFQPCASILKNVCIVQNLKLHMKMTEDLRENEHDFCWRNTFL